jgi:NAD(P)-dependent dehydrogenase (short-subunit alcohol dehydrogenase family)
MPLVVQTPGELEEIEVAKQQFALITGANKGIGFATAREIGAQGVTVFLGSRDPERGRVAARALAAEKMDVRFVALDVTRQESIEAACAEVTREAGRLDILINNAGISVDSASQLTLDGLRRVYETNVFGPFAVTSAFLPLLVKGRPSIVANISSGLGSLTRVFNPGSASRPPYLSYGSSKTALNAITVYWSEELRKLGVTIFCIAPGFTRTDLNNNTGTQPPEKPARLIARLVMESDESRSGGFFDENGPVPW